jgi:hypothetical protein
MMHELCPDEIADLADFLQVHWQNWQDAQAEKENA